MIIPKNEKRKFKVGKLSNKIKYCLIENKELTKTQVCVNVHVGSAMDPLDNMGLAHFLEHMLFLGSKKYPTENFFDKHVKKHGGYTNAYTSTFETVYFFECNNDGIELACDCFSEFFKEPLFNKNGVKREINAINSEHVKNIETKIFRLRHHLFNLSDNPILKKFYTGNLDSFNKNVRDEMIKFYNKYYLSENITICIQSSLNLEKMKKLLNPFKSISDKKFTGYKYSFNKPLLHKKNILSTLEAVEDINEVVFYFEIDYPFNIYKTMADRVVYDIINDTSENSFVQFLIRKGLISQLYSFTLDEGIFCIFMETFDTKEITIKRLINYTNKFFNYLKKLDWSNIINFTRVSNRIFFDRSENYQDIGITNFITSNLHKYGTKYFYSGENIIFANNNDVNKDIQQILKNYKNHKIIVYNKNNKKWEHRDKYYKMGFNINKYPSNLPTEKLSNIDYQVPVMTEPKVVKTKNMFKPEKFNNIFYMTNISFKEPLIYGTIFYHLPDSKINSVDKMVKLQLYVNYVNELSRIKLNHHNKMGNDVNIKLNLFDKVITVTLTAYNNMFVSLFYDFKKLIKKLEIEKQLFLKVKKNLIDSYIVRKSNTPWKRMNYFIHNKLSGNKFTVDNILLKLKEEKKLNIINFSKLKKYLYIVGNFDNKLLELLDKNFNDKVKKNNNDFKYVLSSFRQQPEKLNCLQYQYLIGKYEPKNNCLLLLLTNILDSTFFNKFRTEKQYGYLVALFTSAISIDSVKQYYFTMKIQTEKSITLLEKDLSSFVNEITTIVKETNIKPYISSLVKKFSENLKNTSELYGNFYYEILSKNFNFNKKEQYLSCLKKIKKIDLINFIKKYIVLKEPIVYLLKK